MKKKILVIDDSETNFSLFQSIMEQNRQIEVLFENKEKIGTERIRKIRPNLIILDLLMSEAESFQLLYHIKANKKLCHIPVYILSGCENNIAVMKVMEIGADEYFSKPVNPKNLYKKISQELCLKNKIKEV
jgi:two-component system, cell cycle response regulator DivK